MSDIAGIIPTRGGSEGLPGKCMATVAGTSLIGHAVQQALRTIGSAYVITDHLEHAEEARRHGAVALVVDHTVPGDALPEHQEHRALFDMFPEILEPYSSVCRLFVTHPLRADHDVLHGMGLHRETGHTVVSMSVAEHQEHQVVLPLLGRNNDGRLTTRSVDPRRPRQLVQPADRYLVGCFYLATVESYRRHAFWPPDGFRGVEVPILRALDVDTPQDLERVRMLWGVKDQLDTLR